MDSVLKLSARLLTLVILLSTFLIGLFFTILLLQVFVDPTIIQPIERIVTATPTEIRYAIMPKLMISLIITIFSNIALYNIFGIGMINKTKLTYIN